MTGGRNFSISENTSYKIVALLITIILWVVILGSKESSMIKMVPTEYIFPRDMVVINSIPREVAFKLTGPRLALKRYSDVVEPLTIDLSSATEGLTTIRIHPDSINVPNSIRVFSVSPAIITPHLERVVSRILPVEVAIKGTLKAGKRLSSITPNPNQVEVSGARSVLERLKYIRTQPIDLEELSDSATLTIPLAIDSPGLVKESDTQVKVQVVVN